MRASLFFAAVAAIATSPFVAAAADAGSVSLAPVTLPPNATAVSPHPEHRLEKRTLCILGICIGGSSYDSDVNNCGSRGNRCSTSWPNGGGAVCSAGVCGPAYCNNLFDFNWLTGTCQNVASDTNNCGKCGQQCSVANAASTTCVSGQCYAASCVTGYTLSSGTCTKTIDTTSDVNNCGGLNKKCPSSWAYGSGSTCKNSICQPASCNQGYAFDYGTSQCRNLQSDSSNCGSLGNVCAFPFGSGSCSSGTCKLNSCITGYYNINGVCTSLNLQTDVNNCGSVGNQCTYPNGVATCSGGSCSLTGCTSGYQLQTSAFLGFLFPTTSCVAIDTTRDADNCGSVGNKCTFANGAGTCTQGQCKYSGCNTGFQLVSNVCKAMDLTSDINNCGSVGNSCKFDSGLGVGKCLSGQCAYVSCSSPYELVSGQCQYRNLLVDPKNCGAVGNACPASYSNGGAGFCFNGKCKTQCKDLFAFDTAFGFCRDCSSDAQNCGALGNTCSFPLGSGTCTGGQCVYTSCTGPYALSAGKCNAVDLNWDANNCGKVGNVCPSSYTNGGHGICVLGNCQTTCNNLFDFDNILGFCRDVSSDVQNCGKCGQKCNVPNAVATACKSGSCIATACEKGYNLQNGACSSIDLSSDVNNCGQLGKCCQFLPAGATGTCQKGQCVTTGCPAKYTLLNGACVKSTASQRARVKKSKITAPKSLCPSPNEVACPIVGSSTYAQAVAQHFTSATEFSGVFAGEGGYECLDVTQALDSCGGCASTGEGQDCTKIRGAVSMGCESSQCVVYSCEAGWKPALSGDKCVRIRTHSSSHNSTARRHIAARHHLSHGSSL